MCHVATTVLAPGNGRRGLGELKQAAGDMLRQHLAWARFPRLLPLTSFPHPSHARTTATTKYHCSACTHTHTWTPKSSNGNVKLPTFSRARAMPTFVARFWLSLEANCRGAPAGLTGSPSGAPAGGPAGAPSTCTPSSTLPQTTHRCALPGKAVSGSCPCASAVILSRHSQTCMYLTRACVWVRVSLLAPSNHPVRTYPDFPAPAWLPRVAAGCLLCSVSAPGAAAGLRVNKSRMASAWGIRDMKLGSPLASTSRLTSSQNWSRSSGMLVPEPTL